MEMRELPRSLIIIGGGYIALELGQMFHRFGVEVTILERNEQLLAHGYEPGVGKTIGEVFEKEGVRVLTRVPVRSVRQDREETIVSADVDGNAPEIRFANLLFPTARHPTS